MKVIAPDSDRDVKKDRGGTVGKSLRARARGLGGGDKPHDSGESGLVPDCGNSDAKTSATGNCSRDNLGTWSLRHRFGLAGNHGLVNIGRALNNHSICRNTASGPNKNDVANAQLRERNRFSIVALDTFGSVRKKGGERIERAARLGNGSHFKPVTEEHDRNQRREFPPNVNLEQAECRSERSSKCGYDPQADESHHAGLVIGKFAPCSADENEAAINEDDCSKDGGNKF